MKLVVFLILLGVLRVGANSNAQVYRINLALENVTREKAIEAIKKQTNLDFFFSNKEVDVNKKVTISVKDAALEDVLKEILGEGYGFRLVDNMVVIRPVAKDAPQAKQIIVKGKVLDSKKTPIPGATVLVKGTTIGTATTVDGNFALALPEMTNIVLVFSFIGMETVEIKYTGQAELDVTLKEGTTEMDEVVVTGIFERKAESFTGSAATYKGDVLKTVSSQNVLQSLKTLDPSFHIEQNILYGSDPNRLPDIEIRGKSSIVGVLSEYEVNPNQPLFILDGFEVPLQTVIDLNMERVASVTLLKDAASSAIYGSRAANGVVVIETKKPAQGKLNFSYSGDYSITMPDLSDYNLMNAREKLEFEYKARLYVGGNYETQLKYDQLYNERLRRVESGINTYWMNEPLRTGFSNKQYVSLNGGDQSISYALGLSYKNENGVMENSGNDVLAFDFRLQYRTQKFLFMNSFTLDYSEMQNAPVSFQEYAQTNPYYSKDFQGDMPRFLFVPSEAIGYTITNPLYNASLNYLDQGENIGFRNYTNIEWRPIEGLRLTGRLGLNKSYNTIEKFKSPLHTVFEDKPKLERGEYAKRVFDNWNYDAELILSYNRTYAEKHLVSIGAGARINSNRSKSDEYKAIGFSDDEIMNPAFATQYPLNGKPIYQENTRRSADFYGMLNYSYDGRYSFDFSYRVDGSSVFGAKKRFTDSWAVGVAWELQNETFIGDWTSKLRLRASVGKAGNQNYSNYISQTSYIYNSDLQNLFGIGAGIGEYGNPNLKWEQVLKYTIGADIAVLHDRLRLTVDLYKNVTDPLLISMATAPSVGTTIYRTNFGIQNTKGIDGTLTLYPIYRPAERITWAINLNGRHQTQVYDKIGNRLDKLNEELQKSSLKRYLDGASPNDIWAVRSAGIDPMTGNEVYIKKNGAYSFDYDVTDEAVIGNTTPQLEGVLGTNVQYKNLNIGLYFRYRLNADVFNNQLFDKIERISFESAAKYNQDKRALHERWQRPGDISQYRNIEIWPRAGGEQPQVKTSRYLQKENSISGESVTVGYELQNKQWMRAVNLKNVRIQATMNELFRASTIKSERGIEYPFARTMTLSLRASF